MREWIKALPLGLGLPVVIGAASVKPEDAVSNIAAWLQYFGIHKIPAWIQTPSADSKVIWITLSSAAIYSFAVWGLPPIVRKFRNKKSIESPEPTQSSMNEKPPILPKSLKELFDRDFPNFGKKMRPINLNYDNSETINCMMLVHQDFDSGTEFISFYVPKCGKTPEVCDYFINNFRRDYDQLKNTIHFNIRARGEPIMDRSADLRLSGRVYLYHEDELAYQAMAQVTQLFEKHDLTVRFRGAAYAADEWRGRLLAQS